MAFMQETPRSLKAYLILVGILGAAGQIYQVVLSPEVGPFTRLLGLVGLVISVAFLWVGITFRSLLSTAPNRIEQLLIVGAVYSILLTLIVGVMSPRPEERGGALAQGLIGLLITLYLLRNVRRLARETQGPRSPTGGPTLPPAR